MVQPCTSCRGKMLLSHHGKNATESTKEDPSYINCGGEGAIPFGNEQTPQ